MTGFLVPGWTVRVALAIAAGGALTLAMIGVPSGGPGTLVGMAMALLAVGTVVAPGSAMVLMFLAGVIGYRLAEHGSTVDGGVIALVALLPLVHQLAGWGAVISMRTRFRPAVLRPAAVRFLAAIVPVEIALAVAAAVG